MWGPAASCLRLTTGPFPVSPAYPPRLLTPSHQLKPALSKGLKSCLLIHPSVCLPAQTSLSVHPTITTHVQRFRALERKTNNCRNNWGITDRAVNQDHMEDASLMSVPLKTLYKVMSRTPSRHPRLRKPPVAGVGVLASISQMFIHLPTAM